MGSYYIGPRGEICTRDDYLQLLERDDDPFPALGRSNGSTNDRRTDKEINDSAERS